MLNFLFWNIDQKDLTESLIRLVAQHQIDILMLAECPIRPGNLLARLNETATQYHYAPGLVCQRIEVFTRFPGQFLRPVEESDRFSIRRLTLPGRDEILVAMVHMQSKRHQSEASQAAQCRVLSLEIRAAESQAGH